MPRVLIAVTSHDQLGSLGRKTGYWLGEVTHFWKEMIDAGVEVDFVSPKGGAPPVDEKSQAPRDRANRAFSEHAPSVAQLAATLTPDAVDPARYDAIYFAGGHGAMWDFPTDSGLTRLAEAIYEKGGVVAAVCHGSAALLNLKRADGKPLVAGQAVTGFANLEERLAGLMKHVPFALEDQLKQKGAAYKRAFLPFTSHVEVGDRLVTGQNPQSARATARAVLELLPKA
jgi:putative intracellular protease/amidase